jgi:hypothetical protein
MKPSPPAAGQCRYIGLASNCDTVVTPFSRARQLGNHGAFLAMRDAPPVFRTQKAEQREEHTMSAFRKLQGAVATALVLTSVGLAVAEARPMSPPQGEFINQPGNPFVCRTDEGYGRWTNCDQGG